MTVARKLEGGKRRCGRIAIRPVERRKAPAAALIRTEATGVTSSKIVAIRLALRSIPIARALLPFA